MATYGHVWLGLVFRKLLDTEVDGFVHKGKHYEWQDIVKIHRLRKASDFAFVGLSLMPHLHYPAAYVYLNDGKCIQLMGRLLQRLGEEAPPDSLRGNTKAFDELVSLLEQKRMRNSALTASAATPYGVREAAERYTTYQR